MVVFVVAFVDVFVVVLVVVFVVGQGAQGPSRLCFSPDFDFQYMVVCLVALDETNLRRLFCFERKHAY